MYYAFQLHLTQKLRFTQKLFLQQFQTPRSKLKKYLCFCEYCL